MRKDRQSPIVLMSEYVPSYIPERNGYHPENFRLLNCWECYQAQGKMCIDKEHDSLYEITKSSFFGDGFCCKPDYNEGYCQTGYRETQGNLDLEILCSPPAYDTSTSLFNPLYYAFCPATKLDKCGFPGNQSTNMSVKVGTTRQ